METIDPRRPASDAYLHRAARVAVLLALPAIVKVKADDWPQFRGPHGSGVSIERALPAPVSPAENLAWKAAVLAGVSSPVIVRGEQDEARRQDMREGSARDPAQRAYREGDLMLRKKG